MASGSAFILSCCLVTCLLDYTSCGSDVRKTSKSRKRRYLVYPEGTDTELIMGFGLPIVVQEQSLTMGTVLKLLYDVPSNSSAYTDPVFNRERRAVSRTSRWDIYAMLETTCDRLGLDGRACVLRAICEAADATLLYNGLAGEVLHVLLTPSTTTDEKGSYLDGEYHAAERLGMEVSGSCHLLYPECQVGLLDFISQVEGL